MELTGAIERSPAAHRHLLGLLAEVESLRKLLRGVDSITEATNFFLLEYDDLLSRCPAHAREPVLEALHRLVQECSFSDPNEPRSFVGKSR